MKKRICISISVIIGVVIIIASSKSVWQTILDEIAFLLLMLLAIAGIATIFWNFTGKSGWEFWRRFYWKFCGILGIVILLAMLPFHYALFYGTVFSKEHLTLSNTFITREDVSKRMERVNNADLLEQQAIQQESLHGKLIEKGIIFSVKEEDEHPRLNVLKEGVELPDFPKGSEIEVNLVGYMFYVRLENYAVLIAKFSIPSEQVDVRESEGQTLASFFITEDL
jgi:hypothetical protein